MFRLYSVGLPFRFALDEHSKRALVTPSSQIRTLFYSYDSYRVLSLGGGGGYQNPRTYIGYCPPSVTVG